MNIILIFGINNEVGNGHHTFLTFKGWGESKKFHDSICSKSTP